MPRAATPRPQRLGEMLDLQDACVESPGIRCEQKDKTKACTGGRGHPERISTETTANGRPKAPEIR